VRPRLFACSAAVAIAFDMDDSSVVHKRIQQGGDHGGVTRGDTGPVFEGDVSGDDRLDDIEAITLSSDRDIIRLGWKGPARSGNRL
jgi:hypothetical protein